MDHFHLSRSFVRTVLRGTLHFSSYLDCNNAPRHSYRCKFISIYVFSAYVHTGFNMRMDGSWPRDLAMSSSTNIVTDMTYALFHGCDEDDVKILTDWLKITCQSAGHPMLLPAIFAELQLRRHKRSCRESWTKLVTLYAETGQYSDPLSEVHPLYKSRKPFTVNETTRQILGLYQDTGFLEKGLLKTHAGLDQMISQLHPPANTAPKPQQDFTISENARIRGRLQEISSDYQALIAECKVITDGTSLLNSAVSRKSTLLHIQLLTVKGMEPHCAE